MHDWAPTQALNSQGAGHAQDPFSRLGTHVAEGPEGGHEAQGDAEERQVQGRPLPCRLHVHGTHQRLQGSAPGPVRARNVMQSTIGLHETGFS